jgi:3-oxoacyl-[acyl-carrier-protein] synthase-3
MEARSAILGVGSHVPSKVVTNHDLAKLMTTSDEWIFQRSGIKERRFIEDDGIGASDLAVPASQMALRARGREEGGDRRHHLRHALARRVLPGLGLLSSATSSACRACRRSTSATSARASSTASPSRTRGSARACTRTCSWSAPRCTRRAWTSPTRARRGGALRRRRRRGGPRPHRGHRAACRAWRSHADGVGAQDLWLEAPASQAHAPRITHEMIDEGRTTPDERQAGVPLGHREDARGGPRGAAQGRPRPQDVDLFVPHQANMRINQLVALASSRSRWRRSCTTSTATATPPPPRSPWRSFPRRARLHPAISRVGSGRPPSRTRSSARRVRHP